MTKGSLQIIQENRKANTFGHETESVKQNIKDD